MPVNGGMQWNPGTAIRVGRCVLITVACRNVPLSPSKWWLLQVSDLEVEIVHRAKSSENTENCGKCGKCRWLLNQCSPLDSTPTPVFLMPRGEPHQKALNGRGLTVHVVSRNSLQLKGIPRSAGNCFESLVLLSSYQGWSYHLSSLQGVPPGTYRLRNSSGQWFSGHPRHWMRIQGKAVIQTMARKMPGSDRGLSVD